MRSSIAQPSNPGTGVIDPFVRIQHDNGPTQRALASGRSRVHTSGRPVQYYELPTPLHADLTLGEIPTVTIDGVLYLQFLLDINEPSGGGQNLLSLDQVKIYTNTVGSLTGLETTLGTLRWYLSTSLDDPNVVTLDYSLNSGSGQGDMQMYFPAANFAGVASRIRVPVLFLRALPPSDYQSEDGSRSGLWGTPECGAFSAPPVGSGLVLALFRRR